MFGLLHEYLVENRGLYLRGTGQLQIVHQPASFDVANQLLNPPHNTIRLQSSQQAGSLQPLMAFISRQLGIAEENAFSLYEAFCNQLQQDIENRRQVNWHHLGTFKKDETGNTIFIEEPALSHYNEAVTAKRIIRKNASHAMMVGTRETTNTAMRELLGEQPEAVVKSRWWIAATILGIISIALIFLKKMHYL
jgi:hypothetical protein